MHIAINFSNNPLNPGEQVPIHVAVAIQRDHPDYEDFLKHKNSIIGRAWAQTPEQAVIKLLPKVTAWRNNPDAVELPLDEFTARVQAKIRNMGTARDLQDAECCNSCQEPE